MKWGVFMCTLNDLECIYTSVNPIDLSGIVGIDTAIKRAVLDTRIAQKYIEVFKDNGFDENGKYSIIAFGRLGEENNITDCMFRFEKPFHIVKYKNNYVAVVEKEFSFNDNFEGFNCRVGVSSVQTGMKDFSRLYKQAMSSLRAAYILDEDVMLYDNTSILSVILAIEDRQLLTEFYKKRLSDIEDYDNENNSELIETLFCYLKADGDNHEGARLMDIDDGEMSERMNKIRKICGREFNCADEKCECLTAIYVKKSLDDEIEV
jgi:hypothetical protein